MRAATSWGIGVLACALLTTAVGTAAAQTPGLGTIGSCVVPATSARMASPAPIRSQRVQTDARTNAVFFFSSTDDGARRMTVRAGELDVDKVVYPDGRFRLTLRTGDDVVSIGGLPGNVEVQRDKGRGRSLEVGRASEDDWLRLKVMLAGSKAVRMFRGLANALDDGTLKTPAGTAVLLSDGLLALLDGDPGVVRRLGERWRPAGQAKIRPATLRQVPAFLGCWVNYETAIYQAYLEYGQCQVNDWLWQLLFNACDWEYVLKAESIWFQFVGCSMFLVGG